MHRQIAHDEKSPSAGFAYNFFSLRLSFFITYTYITKGSIPRLDVRPIHRPWIYAVAKAARFDAWAIPASHLFLEACPCIRSSR